MGDILETVEASALFNEMDQWNVTHCPHGRPVYVEISLEDVAKWFKRT